MKLKDKKIRILQKVKTTSPNGFPVYVYKPIHSGRLWAYYRQLSGREFYASAMVNASEEVVFSVNWRTDVKTDMFIEYSGNFYDITRIDDYEGYKNDLDIYGKLAADQNIEVTEPEAG